MEEVVEKAKEGEKEGEVMEEKGEEERVGEGEEKEGKEEERERGRKGKVPVIRERENQALL